MIYSLFQKKRSYMKISVAGTGFASFICIKYLVDLGIKPIVLDVGNKINEKNKIEIKSNSIRISKEVKKAVFVGAPGRS